MTRYLLSALGSAGDVHPFIAIGEALRGQGHDVTLIASPHFEARIRRTGIGFAPLGESGDYERLLQRPELWHPRQGARFILDELLKRLPEAYAVTRALATGTDTVLVGSTLSWGMRLVQEVTRLPAATVHLSPVCIWSADGPPILPGIGDLSWMPRGWLRSLQRAAERLLLDRWIGPRLNAFRGSLGLDPVARIWSGWMHAPDLVIGAWPSWFAPVQSDWPPRSQVCGFPVFDEAAVVPDPALEAFLDTGPAPIGVTPGSAMAHGEAFVARGLEACRALGHRVLVITPYREQLPDVLPAGTHHVAYAPFSALMPRLAALIHHGGIGTSAQALRAGVPQAVAPFAHDQFDNAARLRRLGVSSTLNLKMPVEEWVASIRRLLASATTADCAREWAGRIVEADPAPMVIARQLEGLRREPDP